MFIVLPTGKGKKIALDSRFINSIVHYDDDTAIIDYGTYRDLIPVNNLVDFTGLIEKLNQIEYGRPGNR